MSESVEMYLVMTALLRSAPDEPVAVSHLAGKLGVSQVSANEMCHKLSERGLMAYQPYKGVTLTAEGEAQAQQILSRRRLWVIFLVENLGIGPAEADELACQLEHITSERLVTALRAFLERAPYLQLSATAMPDAEARVGQPVNKCAVGTRGIIARVAAEPAMTTFLQSQGLTPGAEAEVLVVGPNGAALLGTAAGQVALAPSIASRVMLSTGAVNQLERHKTWLSCSAFWSCLHGETCACMPAAGTQG